jgi:S-layer homology domain
VAGVKEGNMVRRLTGVAFATLALSVAIPAVSAAPSDAPVRLGDAPQAIVREGKAGLRPHTTRSPFASKQLDPGSPEYVVATADIQTTYTGFTAEAQAAFEYAVKIWERHIYSPRIIHINANWAALGPGVLGGAGSQGVWASGGKAWPKALLEATCNCPVSDEVGANHYEINATFSSAFSDWYMGMDANPSPAQIDFVTVVLHEIGHGLGISTSGLAYNSGTGQGSWGYSGGYTTNYGLALYSAPTGGLQLMNAANYANPSTELGNALKSTSVYWQGTNVSAVLGGARARIYAPSSWEQGSSIHHLNDSTYPPASGNSLMTPFIDYDEGTHNPGPIAMAMLRDIGWDAEGCSAAPFLDVATSHPFCLEIKWMKDNNISTGSACPGGTCYSPSNNVARQAMAAFMARLDGDVLTACATAPFDDVPTNHTFCQEIKWMKDNGISTGQACPSGPGTCYLPASNVTRQAMSAFMARLALGAAGAAALPACASAPFSDVDTSHPFCKEIRWMKETGVSRGFSDGTYRPADAVTRQAMSAFLFRVNSQLT